MQHSSQSSFTSRCSGLTRYARPLSLEDPTIVKQCLHFEQADIEAILKNIHIHHI